MSLSQPGNKSRSKGKLATDALRKAAAEGKFLPRIAKKVLELAADGDMTAIKEVFDRFDGKAVQISDNHNETVVKHVKATIDELREFEEEFNQDYPPPGQERISEATPPEEISH